MGGTYVQRLFFGGKGGFDALQNPLSSTPLAVAWLRQHAVMLKIGEHKLSVNCSTFLWLATFVSMAHCHGVGFATLINMIA